MTSATQADTPSPNESDDRTIRLRDVARWQLPDVLEPNEGMGQRKAPDVLAGLPSLQRGTVWRPNQIELLWDSILRGFPIGSLVACRRLPKEKQHTRAGAVAISEGDNKLPWPEDQYTHHLLDGQQRANAVALAYLDPFSAQGDRSRSKTILWLDLDPSRSKDRFPAASTRHHLLRVTTEAHPWGFGVSDDKEPVRISSGEAYEAIRAFQRVHPQVRGSACPEAEQSPETSYSSRQRPSPCEGWPVKANAPLPLAWALLEAEKLTGTSEGAVDTVWASTLWNAVLTRVNAVQARGRATGATDSAVIAEGSPAESTAHPDPDDPWWTKVARVLTEWTAETASESRQLQALRLAQALRRAVNTRLVILTVPKEALDAPSRLEAQAASHPHSNENVANLEHLFARLNNGGTSLSADDLAYSMIKAYWPGIEQTIAGIERRPPETQVALLGARLARAEAAWRDIGKPAPSLPAAPNVSAIRQLGAARAQTRLAESADTEQREQQLERQAWRTRMESVFGLPSSGGAPLPAKETPLAQALARVDAWFSYSPLQRWGLPPVLLSRMATQSSEVYLFLLWLAHHNGTAPVPDENIRRPLLGLATALQWFSIHAERAVRELWTVEPRQWLSGEAFESRKWLDVLGSLKNAKQQPAPAIPFIPTPDELAHYIDEHTLTPDESIKDWRWWDTLVVKAAKQEWEKTNPEPAPSTKDLDNARDERWKKWSGVIRILSERGYGGANALLLMYAQREQMHHYFSDVDTRDTGFWDKHNVPWDFDHLLQQRLLRHYWTGKKYQDLYQEWGYTIANLHLLPFFLNRARRDKPLIEAFKYWSQEDWKRALLWDDEDKTGRQRAFSMSDNDVRDETSPAALDRVYTFTTEARARLLRIYRDWFKSLAVGRLLDAE